MVQIKNFLEFIDERQKTFESFLEKNNALDQMPEQCESPIFGCYEKLALVYKIQKKSQQYHEILHRIVKCGNPHFTSQKNEDAVKRVKNNEFQAEELRTRLGQGQFAFGTFFILAQEDLPRAKQLFEWAVINCTLPDEYLTRKHSSHLMVIAFSYLWKGYALLSLERYEEAYDCLTKVAPIYQSVKKTGGEVWHTVEFALTKALVPLCEFKLNPTKENLKKAQNGVEDYIKSIHDNKFKLDGYIYYFHLKEQFADVYSADPKTYSEPVVKNPTVKPRSNQVSLSEDTDKRGTVIINDPEKTQALEVLASNDDFQKFVDYVKNLGGFPELAGLMDLYTLGQCADAKPIAAESRKFITTPGIDPAMRTIARRIYDVAKEAADADSVVMLYYDPEVSPDLLE